MRKEEASATARSDGVGVLQRLFRHLLARKRCRQVCYDLMDVIREQREHGRRLLQEDILRQAEADAATRLQAAWRGWAWRRRLAERKAAGIKVTRFYRRLHNTRLAMKEEKAKLNGPEVFMVCQQGAIVSGVALMLSVFRCGFSFKFVGRDQEACWSHQGFCYEFEVMEILRKHNEAIRRGHVIKGAAPIEGSLLDRSKQNKVVALLVSKLALVDAIRAPTTELRSQHRYKTLVVYDGKSSNSSIERSTSEGSGKDTCSGGTGKLRGPGILTSSAERGRALRDTRALVTPGYKRYLKAKEKWNESRRKAAYLQQQQQIEREKAQ